VSRLYNKGKKSTPLRFHEDVWDLMRKPEQITVAEANKSIASLQIQIDDCWKDVYV